MAAPMPRDPPVTKTVLPVRSVICRSPDAGSYAVRTAPALSLSNLVKTRPDGDGSMLDRTSTASCEDICGAATRRCWGTRLARTVQRLDYRFVGQGGKSEKPHCSFSCRVRLTRASLACGNAPV